MITRRLTRPLAALPSSGWVCASCARASLLQSRQQQQQQQQQQRTRSLHNPPRLTHLTTFSRDGVPGLLSPQGFEMAWTQHMDMMIAKLNELTAGEASENATPKDILLRYARDPMNASLFNHASMVENSRIFFEGLSTAPQHLEDAAMGALKASLEETFGSIDTFRTAFLDTAAAMFGPGFVWLVWANNVAGSSATGTRRGGAWRILTTYNAGTPYPEAGYRQQGMDMNTNNPASFDTYTRSLEPENHVGSFGNHTASGRQAAKIPPGGTSVMPVLCVSTWQHVYLYDFGVAGKRKFLADWWAAIDWAKVDGRAPAFAKQSKTFL